MRIVLYWLIGLTVLELLLWLPSVWRLKKFVSSVTAPLLMVAATALFVIHPRIWTGVLAWLSYYRTFNLLRILKGRMHAAYLRGAYLRSSLWLMVSQLVVLGVFVVVTSMSVNDTSRWAVVGALQLVGAVIIMTSTLRHVRKTREPITDKSYADRDLPTLSVAIPARNETEDLEACLQALTSSDYPKLEILVLDDCSANAKTPEIIRSFAHEGVMFIEGTEPGETWLAKNWAYEKLLEKANGELLLFCGVDTRLAPDGLRTLVATLLNKDKSMLSVLPRNEQSSLASLFVQPMRYAWELSLPRRLFQRPPVLSTCWLIKSSLLKSAGSFKAVSRSVVPESYFARVAAVHDGYSFIRTNAVESQKPFSEQRATAIRTRYPQLHRRPELVSLIILAELLGIVAPFVLFVVGLLQALWLSAILAGLASLLLVVSYTLITIVTYREFKLSSLLLLPVASLFDICLLHYSMYRYEFSEVTWKGRNVCIPVMHVVPHLPSY